MSSPGETISSMVESSEPPQRFFAVFALGLLLMGLGLGAYATTQLTNDNLCLGCLALNPKAADFKGFWVEYPGRHKDTGEMPDHPDWVKSELDKNKVVFIYLWSDPCPSCEEQWEDMKDGDIVEGEEQEDSARMSASYASNVKLISLDANDDGRGTESQKVYDPDGDKRQTPTTIILTSSSGDDNIYWYSDNTKLKASTVENILDAAIEK